MEIKAEDLLELADPDFRRVMLGSAPGYTGVVLPDSVQGGAIIAPEYARKLGAQLIMMANLHDEIAETAVDKYEQNARLARSVRERNDR